MFKIEKIKIDGFWGDYKIETELNSDVNIFIGRNGTGKTTFINLLQAVLSVDLEMLYSIQYDRVVINLKDKKKKRKIEVSKIIEDLQYRRLEYKIGNSKYQIPFIPESEIKYIRRKIGRFPQRMSNTIYEVKDTLKDIIDISYLSVHRDNSYNIDIEERDYRNGNALNAIDLRLKELLSNLTSYELQLETELSRHSKVFQEDVLKSMLYNLEFDSVDVNKEIHLDLQHSAIGLKKAYKSLGLLDTDTSDTIDRHIEAISEAVQAINKHAGDSTQPLYVHMVTPLTLLRRTQKIINLSSELEKKKKSLFKPINEYIELLKGFHETKEFSIKTEKSQGLVVFKEDVSIPLSQLSSGEKQLIILLTEALLQKNKETLFIADEPELSLHIEWQRKVISSIMKLNPNAQVIVATHSPEIAGNFKNKSINMENILK